MIYPWIYAKKFLESQQTNDGNQWGSDASSEHTTATSLSLSLPERYQVWLLATTLKGSLTLIALP